MAMTLPKMINESKGLAMWLHEHIDDVQLTVVERERGGFALMQQALDLDDAIIYLLERNLPGPSLALARPRFETYVRGIWLIYAADEESYSKFLKGKCPNFPGLIKALEDASFSGTAWIRENANLNLKDFHDLTHGGVTHLERRLNGKVVEPCYPEEELISLLLFGTEVRMRIGVEFLSRLKNDEILIELTERAKSFRNRP